MQQPNVSVVRTPIECICEQGIRTSDGAVHEIDVLICATGFDTSFSARYDIIGKSKKSLREAWQNQVPEAYMGLAIAGYPNYFSELMPRLIPSFLQRQLRNVTVPALLGPNCPIANGSLVPCIEAR